MNFATEEVTATMLWLVAHPPQESTQLIGEALNLYVKQTKQPIDQLTAMVEDIMSPEIILGQRSPEDDDSAKFFKFFVSFLKEKQLNSDR